MGRFDRRSSMKMRRRKSQTKLAEREARQVVAVKAARRGPEQPKKKSKG